MQINERRILGLSLCILLTACDGSIATSDPHDVNPDSAGTSDAASDEVPDEVDAAAIPEDHQARVIWDFDFTSMPTQENWVSSANNANSAVPFHLEPGSDPLHIRSAGLVKPTREKYWRMMGKERIGGPGTMIESFMEMRSTSIVGTTGSHPGPKWGIKWPHPDYSGDKSSPVSVHGKSSSTSPGSYQFFTPCTENGAVEVSINALGPTSSNPYEFLRRQNLGYSVGTWLRFYQRITWLERPKVRFQLWVDLDDEGEAVVSSSEPDYDETVNLNNSNYVMWDHGPGFPWWRVDDTEFEIRRWRVVEKRIDD